MKIIHVWEFRMQRLDGYSFSQETTFCSLIYSYIYCSISGIQISKSNIIKKKTGRSFTSPHSATITFDQIKYISIKHVLLLSDSIDTRTTFSKTSSRNISKYSAYTFLKDTLGILMCQSSLVWITTRSSCYNILF